MFADDNLTGPSTLTRTRGWVDIDGDDRTARNVQPASPRRQSAGSVDEPHRHRRVVFDVAGWLERRWVR
jgi:hypothetical protein